MIDVGEVRKGLTIELDGELYSVVDFEHIKMGRGGALARLKLRSVRSGFSFERTFPASEKFRRVFLERRKAQFLYREDNLYTFMDNETFEQYQLSSDQLGDAAPYLKEGLVIELSMHSDQAIGIELAISIEYKVAETDPGFKGDTANAGTKPAILETGLKVNVPLFVKVGDVIRIDTRTGGYQARVS